MKKYKCNYNSTILLIVLVAVLYFLKNLDIVQGNVKIFAYLIVLAINLVMLFDTLTSIKPLNSLLNHKLSGENSKAKVSFLIMIIKDITNTKTKIAYFIIAFFIIILYEIFVFILEALGMDVYKFTDKCLDFIAVMSLSNTFLQSHINYSIHRYLTEEGTKKK